MLYLNKKNTYLKFEMLKWYSHLSWVAFFKYAYAKRDKGNYHIIMCYAVFYSLI